ncbi:MAG: sigma factor-like helix-turn-helix DNA-binding protein [Hyphomicrobium sp.]|uniref:sigma factor-like helix-turn-helix DNA-binding protein n=1 Tax=Hyphomicrobium sp. TaxID=82 RepID=UPI003D0C48A3
MTTPSTSEDGDTSARVEHAASRQAGTERPALVERTMEVLRPLLNYARSEVRMHEAVGDLIPGTINPEEVVDAAVLEALQQADEAPAGRIYPWLRHLVRRVVQREVAAARRRRRERSLEQPIGTNRRDDEETSPPRRLIDVLPNPESPIPEDVVASAEVQQALAAVLQRLPASWREPFVLHAIDGVPLRRVAEFEGLTVAEARRRVERAREFLRSLLAEEYDQLAMPPTEMLFAHLARMDPSHAHAARIRGRLEGDVAARGQDEQRGHPR